MPTELLTDDDRARLIEIAGELEHLPAEFRRHFDQDGRDARFLRILAGRTDPPKLLGHNRTLADVRDWLRKRRDHELKNAPDGLDHLAVGKHVGAGDVIQNLTAYLNGDDDA
jgi:hypothetical protein